MIESDEVTPQDRALRRAAYERQMQLLRDPLAADVTQKMTNPPLDRDAVALMVRLQQHRYTLWADMNQLVERFNLSDSEMEIVVPSADLPLPDDLWKIRFFGLNLRVGAVDDRYRVAPVKRVAALLGLR